MIKFLLLTTLIFSAQLAHSNSSKTLIIRTDTSADFIALPKKNKGLKTMWWNIGCSTTQIYKKVHQNEKVNYAPASQWQNILSTIRRKAMAPDLLILGEYCPRAFDQDVYDEIRSHYPHVHSITKSNALYSHKNGMRIFSKLPLKVEESGILSGEVPGFLKDCPAKIKKKYASRFKKGAWDRPYSILSVKKNNRVYNVSPIHLANPWTLYKMCHGALSTGFELTSGKKNPNYFQAKQLIEKLNGVNNLILIGDFNASKDIYGLKSKSYVELSKKLGESVITGNDPTYSDSTNSIPANPIDHAFTSPHFRTTFAAVLPLAGSDHLPIYLSIEHRQIDNE